MIALRTAKGRLLSISRLCGGASALTIAVALAAPAAQAQTWQGATSDFNTATNWNPNTVPTTGSTGVFANTGQVSVTFSSAQTPVGTFQFNSGAPQYTFTVSGGDGVALQNQGIVNNSSNAPVISTNGGGFFQFENSADAGNAILKAGGGAGSSYQEFFNNSTATNAQVQLTSGGFLVVGTAASLPLGSLTGAAGSTVSFFNVMNASPTPTLTVGSLNTSTAFAGTITQQPDTVGSLVKVGTGTLTLSGVGSYDGGTTVSAGTLAISNSSALGSAGVTLSPGSTLALQGVQLTNSVAVSGDPNISVTGANTMATITGTGTVNILGTSGSAMTDVLTLTAANSYAAATNVGDGTLGHAVTLQAGVVGAFSGFSPTTVTASSVLDINGKDQNVAALAGSGTVTNSTATSAFLINNGAASSTFFGTITGSALKLEQNGTGTLTLTGANTFGGPTVVSQGTIALSGGGSVSHSEVEIAQGATFDISQTTGGTSINGLANSGPSGGSVVLGSNTLTLTNSPGGTFSGGISGMGGLTISGGTQILAGANAYTGATDIKTGGALKFATGGSIAAASATTVAGTLDVNGTAQTITAVQLQGGSIADTAGGGSLTAGVTSTGGTISAALVGVSSLTTISGTTTLSGADTYSGATTINGGMLTASAAGAFSAGSATTINAGGTLDLGGLAQTINGVTLSGGTLQHGSLAGAITETGADNNTINGVIGTASLITVAGSSTTLQGTNVFSGVTNVVGASLTNMGNTTDTLNNAGTFNNNGTYTTNNVVNSGMLTNSGTFNGPVGTNTGAITNNIASSWNGDVASGANTAGGVIANLGTWTDSGGGTGTSFNNGGTLTNSGTWTGNVSNVTGSFANNMNATVSGKVTNAATGSNAGKIGALSNTGGTFTNSGTITGLASITGGTLNTTGEIDGGVTNTATVNAAGVIKGAIANNAGTFTVTGALASDGVSTFTNAPGATLDVKGGGFTNLAELDNSGTTTVETTGSLSAATIKQQAGAFTNDGTVTATNPVAVNGGDFENNGTLKASVVNAATFNNNAPGSVSGSVTNTGAASNAGVIAGAAVNNAGVFTSTGTIGGGVTNSATFNAAGTINGGIQNQAGTFTVNGALAASGTLTNSAAATLSVQSSLTGLTEIDNSGTATVTAAGTVSAPTIKQLAGVFTNDGTITATNPIAVSGGDFENNKTIVGAVTSAATFNNNAGGTVSAGLTVTAGASSNAGAISGGVTVTGGAFTTTGTVNGGLTNSATVDAAGAINGAINNMGAFNVTAALASDGVSTFTNATGATLTLQGGVISQLAEIDNSGTVNLNGMTMTVGTVKLIGGTIENGSLTSTNGIISDGVAVANVSGSTGLTANAGTTRLTADTYTGATTVNNGATVIGTAANAYSAASATTINTGGTADLGGFTQTINNVSLAGGTLQNGSLIGAISSSGGTISGLGGAATLTTSQGVTVLQGSNTYTGATNINTNSTLQAGANNALSQFSVTTVAGTLDLNAGSEIVNSIVLSGGTLKNGSLNGAITEAGADNNTINGVTGVASLTTVAGSTTTLQGTNVFSGVTNVVSASLINMGNTTDTLNNAGTFNNNGTYTTNNVVNSGTLTNSGTFNGPVGANTGAITNNTAANWNGDVASGANTAGGVIANLGTWTDSGGGTGTSFNNGGTLTNSGTWTGDVSNVTGSFANNMNATVSGQVTNAATGSNAGKIGSLANTGGTFTNSGTITGLASITGGTLNTTGEIDGGVTNTAAVNAAGVIKGAIANNAGTFTVTGALASDGVSTFTNATGATLDVKGGGFTNLAELDNSGTTTVETTGSLTVATIKQLAGAFTNDGTVTATNPVAVNGGDFENNGALKASVVNAATFNNNAAGTVSGSVTNSGAASNAGLISGAVTNNAGVFTSTGTIGGGVANSATFNAAGTINGGIQNQAGTFTVTGALAASGTLSNSVGATLSVQAGLTGLTELDNSGIATVTTAGAVSATTIKQLTGAFTNMGAVTATTLTETNGAFTNDGTVTATNPIVVNGGDFENNKSVFGEIEFAATFNNNAGGTLSAGLIVKSGASSNAGAISGGVTVMSGAFTTTGTVNGGLTNMATVNASGAINGTINNQSKFTVTGPLAGDGLSAFDNGGGATLAVQSKLSNLGSLNNAGTVNVAAAGSVAAGEVVQTAGVFNNSGTVTSSKAPVSVIGGVFNTTNTVSGGLTNASTVNAAGTINGPIDNKAVFNVTGALASDNASTFTNEASGTLTVQATGALNQLATLDNSGTTIVSTGGQIKAQTVNQIAGQFYNNGSVVATNPVNVSGGAFVNSGTLSGGAAVTGGVLTTNGAISGGLTNSATVNAQGSIAGGVTNTGVFLVTNTLNNGGGDFTNSGKGTLSFAVGGLSYTGIGTLTNGSSAQQGVIVGAGDTLAANTAVDNAAGSTFTLAGNVTTPTFTNAGTLFGDGAISGASASGGNVVNTGSIVVGPYNAAGSPTLNTNLSIAGNYNGTGGTLYTVADLSKTNAPSTVSVGSVTQGSKLDIAISNQNNTSNVHFGTLTVATIATPGGLFVDTAATQAALTSASNAPGSFYQYSFGQTTTNGQGIIQFPKTGVATAPLTQVASTIVALNSSFFQNSSAFLGSAQNPEPNHVGFGVWNRDAASDTTVGSLNTVEGASSTAQKSSVDTRLAGFQYGADAALYNINNSGMNVHLGATGGDVFASSYDHVTAGVTSHTQVPFVGAYGALTGRGLAVVVGVRYDMYEMLLTNNVEGIANAPLNGHGLTFSTDVSYIIPIGTSGVFAEPSGGVYVSHASMDTQRFAAGSNVFGGLDSTMSRIGLRAGVSTKAGIFLFQPFASMNVFHEFAGDATTTFTPSQGTPTPILINTTRVGTFSQASLGVGWQVPGTGWTGYARSDARFGPNVEGWTLTAGLRYSF